MNKTDRKNKTNLVVNWPTHGGHFTINELIALNPEFKTITLRVRVDNAKKEGNVVEIGSKNMGKGRPQLVLAMAPVSKELLDKAYNQDKIQPPENSVVNVIDTTTPISTTEAPLVDVPLTTPVVNPISETNIANVS